MVTLLITFALILGSLFVIIYFWQRADPKAQSPLLPPPGLRGLFSESPSEFRALEQVNADAALHQHRSAIIERARSGEKGALQEAKTLGDLGLYDEALELLTKAADTDPKLLALISYLTRAELPVSANLARLVVKSWKLSPDRSSTAKTLHAVALADDATLYSDTVETAMQLWREGRLPDVSREELRALFDGEFWLLSSEVRGSGPGFLLKRTLAGARRELDAKVHVKQ